METVYTYIIRHSNGSRFYDLCATKPEQKVISIRHKIECVFDYCDLEYLRHCIVINGTNQSLDISGIQADILWTKNSVDAIFSYYCFLSVLEYELLSEVLLVIKDKVSFLGNDICFKGSYLLLLVVYTQRQRGSYEPRKESANPVGSVVRSGAACRALGNGRTRAHVCNSPVSGRCGEDTNRWEGEFC